MAKVGKKPAAVTKRASARGTPANSNSRKLEAVDRKRKGRISRPGTFTAEKRREFLDLYQTGLTVREASNKVGVSAVTIFNYVRINKEGFGDEYRAAMETNTDALEDDLHTLARNGNVAALFGTLKARRPERWRDRVDVSNQDGSLLKPLAEAIKRAHSIGGGSDSSGK